MSTTKPRILLRLEYEQAAADYCASLPLEHFTESTLQNRQRKITDTSMDLVHAQRPDIQPFGELLIQYPPRRGGRLRQVVPDNMVVVWKDPLKAIGSYDLPFQPTGPIWVLEYLSKSNKRKDYEDSYRKYERELKVPYYLLFYPDDEELTLYIHNGKRYVSVKPDEGERYAIPELELELALRDGWVRYWFRGKLLPLPAELQRELDDTRRQLEDTNRQLAEERRARQMAEDELSRLRAQMEQLKRRNNHK
jgi:Uma2 family endonuclease